MTATMLAELSAEAGCRRACSTSSTASAPRPARPSSTHPDVPAISFTGGTATGRDDRPDAPAPLFKKLVARAGRQEPERRLRRRRPRRGHAGHRPLGVREPGRDLPVRLAHLRRGAALRPVRRRPSSTPSGSCGSATRSTRPPTRARWSRRRTATRSSRTSRWRARRAARSSPAAAGPRPSDTRARTATSSSRRSSTGLPVDCRVNRRRSSARW